MNSEKIGVDLVDLEKCEGPGRNSNYCYSYGLKIWRGVHKWELHGVV
jgi:hypothetical protein